MTMIRKQLPGDEKRSNGSYTEAQRTQQFNLSEKQRNGDVCLGILLGVDNDNRSLDVFADGRRFPDATYAVPHFNTKTGAGIDFLPSLESGDPKQVVVAVFNDNAHVIGVMPKESQAKGSSQVVQGGNLDPDYSKARDDLAPDDIKFKSNEIQDTSIFLKAAGEVLVKANEFCRAIFKASSKTLDVIFDRLDMKSPTFNLQTVLSERTGNSALDMRMKANELDNQEMLQVLVGRSARKQQPTGRTSITLNNTATAPNNTLDLNVDSSINLGSGGSEPVMKGTTLANQLAQMWSAIKTHTHSSIGTPSSTLGSTTVNFETAKSTITFTD
jgi:hypothetical protein